MCQIVWLSCTASDSPKLVSWRARLRAPASGVRPKAFETLAFATGYTRYACQASSKWGQTRFNEGGI